MEKFIPKEKLSKKERKKRDGLKRESWSVSPVTKTVPSAKAYNRKKDRRIFEEYPKDGGFCFYFSIS